jgi:PTH1 family peptidyl-tRNA hydrolase
MPADASLCEWLIVGLGNPGREYEGTRHNVGADTISELARRHGEKLRAGRDKALITETRIGGHKVVLAFPITYMNNSGQAVGAMWRRYRLSEPERLIVVHDELDLPPGSVRVKSGGGLAGHNGLRSITAHLHTQDYLRVRIGVGKPASKDQGANHVLSRLGALDRQILAESIATAADAVTEILTADVQSAMRNFNTSQPGQPGHTS